MDFSTIMAIDSLQQTMEFMQHKFPWISLLVLLFTALSVMLAEKRKRTLLLEQSEEEARIQALPDLSDAQKEQLLKAAAPLPATKEAFPLPDVPLRLVSALSKVFGFLKIVLFLGTIYSMSRIAQMPDSTMSASHPVLGYFLIAGFIGLAVLQIVASAKVTCGSNVARRFLIFMAVLELGTAVQESDLPYAILWRMIIIAMSSYTLWVLLLRKHAQEFVTYRFVPTRVWQKVTILSLCLLSLVTTPFEFNGKARMDHSFHKIESSNSSSSNHGITLPITRIYLQAGDASAETEMLMSDLKEKLKTPVELIGFGQVSSHTMRGGDLYLLVSKTLDKKKPKKPGSQIPRKIRNIIMKEDPEFAKFFQPQSSGDREMAFEIEAPFAHRYFAWGHGRPEIYQMNSLDLHNSLSAEYTGSRKKILGDLGDAAAKEINKFVSQQNGNQNVSALPSLLSTEPESLPEPSLDCMVNAICEARFFSPQQQINFYRIAENCPESIKAVSNELVSVGWEFDYDDTFTKGNEKMAVRGPKKYASQHPLPHTHLIHSKIRSVVLPESFAVDFCQQNYADFIGIFYAKTVPADILREATLKYLEQPDLSAKELYKVYNSISGVEALNPIKPELLYRFAEELHKTLPSEQAFRLYQNLGKEIMGNRRGENPWYDKIVALYADQITHLELEKGTNGFDRAEITLQGVERPQLITFSKTRDDLSESREQLPFYFLGWVESIGDEKYKRYSASPGGSGISEGTDFAESYMTVHGLSSGYSCGGSWGEVSQWFSAEDRTKPGALTLLHSVSLQTGELTVKVLFNDNSLIVSRASDGRYIFNKMRMTKEQLIRALNALHRSNERLVLIVILDKAERKEFKKLLSEIPRSARVKYEDPPKSDGGISI